MAAKIRNARIARAACNDQRQEKKKMKEGAAPRDIVINYRQLNNSTSYGQSFALGDTYRGGEWLRATTAGNM